ncbi:matrix metalloproteinase-24-like [Anoplophora glabripennis]|uniref:matrix metalloproteinase-24-like n=1 Tax=Anoplophora glabripennis TaxID=217634 RepID=UPI000C787E42|nr:matrix metalloproteinase-24-like [Anoplophora glabripennis]
MIWTEPKDHFKHTVQYPNFSSANRPILHSAELPVPKPPNQAERQDSVPSPEFVHSQHDEVSQESDPSYEPSTSKEPHLLTQSDLNDLKTRIIDEANILIHYTPRSHSNYWKCMKGVCQFPFDGPGVRLAHAYFPITDDKCKEIHLDSEEHWYEGLEPGPAGTVALLPVLMHEIGHTLGLSHTTDVNVIMYPWFKTVYSLGEDDVHGIQFLYGAPLSTTTHTPTTPIPRVKSINPPTTTTGPLPRLCDVKKPEKMLITSNHHFYIFNGEVLWIVELKNYSYGPAVRVSSYTDIAPIDFIYQRPNEEFVVISGVYYYIVEFPSLRIKHGYKKIPLTMLGLKNVVKIP